MAPMDRDTPPPPRPRLAALRGACWRVAGGHRNVVAASLRQASGPCGFEKLELGSIEPLLRRAGTVQNPASVWPFSPAHAAASEPLQPDLRQMADAGRIPAGLQAAAFRQKAVGGPLPQPMPASTKPFCSATRFSKKDACRFRPPPSARSERPRTESAGLKPLSSASRAQGLRRALNPGRPLDLPAGESPECSSYRPPALSGCSTPVGSRTFNALGDPCRPPCRKTSLLLVAMGTSRPNFTSTSAGGLEICSSQSNGRRGVAWHPSTTGGGGTNGIWGPGGPPGRSNGGAAQGAPGPPKTRKPTHQGGPRITGGGRI